MDKDFEWVKWVGFSIVVCVLVIVFYSAKSKNELAAESTQNINYASNHEKESFDHDVDQVTQAMIESEQEAKEKQNNPPVYQTLSLEQTKDFIQRVEDMRQDDININLDSTPDVARQSRKYNALYEEAESIYGTTDITNDLRYCTVFVNAASDLWRLRYSPSKDAAFDKHAIQININTLKDAKQACLDDVQNKESHHQIKADPETEKVLSTVDANEDKWFDEKYNELKSHNQSK